jgi:transposase
MARRLGAWLVFLDETGLLLAPLVRATWALCGQTPELEQTLRHPEKLSVIGALCVSPDLRRLRLYLAFFPKDSIDGELTRFFVADLLRHLAGLVVLVWDRLGAHRGEEMEEFLAEHPRLKVEEFPPYCPELNPVEWLWRWLKWDKLANFAPASLEVLDERAGALCVQARRDQDLLRSFIVQSELPLDLVDP